MKLMNMSARFSLGAAALILVGAHGAMAQSALAGSDSAAVRVVVERYLHGLKFNDTTALHDAFWGEARLFFVNRQGEIGQLTQAAWYRGIAASAGHEEEGTLRIAALEVTRDIASAKVVEEYPTSRYTDYISLLSIRGRWWIVNKIYTAEKK